MTDQDIDIIIPVWNRLMETRACLVSLVTHTPGARLVLVDNGSERETQRLLQEFAEELEHRALLICNNVNLGFVKALNIGIERSEAKLVAVVRNTTTVSAGWFQPMLDKVQADPHAGILVPWLVNRDRSVRGTCDATPLELSSGSFAAMLIRREVCTSIGTFDEEMDGGHWCLLDYSRRAGSAGYLTMCAPGGKVSFEDDVLLGSEVRRQAAQERSIELFRQRWGVSGEYGVLFPKGTDVHDLLQKLELMLLAARRGHRFVLFLTSGVRKQVVQAGYHLTHENIRIQELPFFLTDGRLSKILARLVADQPGITLVAGVDGMMFPEIDRCLPFSMLQEITGG